MCSNKNFQDFSIYRNPIFTASDNVQMIWNLLNLTNQCQAKKCYFFLDLLLHKVLHEVGHHKVLPILEEYLLQKESITHSFIVHIWLTLNGQSRTSFIYNKVFTAQALTYFEIQWSTYYSEWCNFHQSYGISFTSILCLGQEYDSKRAF